MEPGPSRDRISDLYHRALECTPEDRGAFLEEACDGDAVLRDEVESLLRYESDSEEFLETPAAVVERDLARTPDRSQMIGRQLGPYTLVAPLGAGGMGEVYRARDSKLGRDVAIKILPSHFTSDPERRARFAREARLLATLNHPNIGAIYGLEETDGVTALVLELVEGPTLADRLARGPLPIDEAVAIARQIAEALDAAHEKGTVHRDLKPANVVLQSSANASGVPSGAVRAKVLDFGLAKTMAVGLEGDLTQRPSGSLDGTEEGRILGTPAYMSPELARGQPVDKRTDIWAFGCVLYEMLVGRSAFEGKTITDTLALIIERDPDWAALPRETPPAIRTLLQRCLRKDPQLRLHDIADARIELDDRGSSPSASAEADATSFVVARQRRRERIAWIVAAAAVVIASSAVALLYLRPVPAAVGPLEFPIVPPEHWYLGADTRSPSFEISPDGRYITAAALSQGVPGLWIRSIANPPWRQLPGTEGGGGPFWSPDSQSIGFFAGGQLKTISLSGGAPVIVSDAPGGSQSGAWSRNGFILFGGTSLWKVRETGGNRMPVTTLGRGETARGPSFLPDGEHFLYLAQTDAVYELRVGSLSSSDTASLGPFESNAVYAAGHLLFVRGRRLMAQPFDAVSRQWKGDAVVVADETAVVAYVQRGQFSVSSTGVLGYCPVGTGVLSQLTWMDRTGKTLGTAGEPGVYMNLDLSPDERRVAVSRHREVTERPGAPFDVDIWLIDLVRTGTAIRLTDHPAREFDPAWSANGTWIAFNSTRDGGTAVSLFQRRSSRSGEDEPLVRAEGTITSPDWSPDGRHLLYAERRAATGHGLWTLSLTGDRQRSVFLDTKYNEAGGAFSPDGRWIAYVSDESGRNQVYVRPFPLREGLTPISQDGGWAPRWRGNGRELFFLAPDGAVMAAGIKEVNGNLDASVPQLLFSTGLGSTTHNLPYAVTADGQRFLVPVKVDPPGAAPITVVMDWLTRLAKQEPER